MNISKLIKYHEKRIKELKFLQKHTKKTKQDKNLYSSHPLID